MALKKGAVSAAVIRYWGAKARMDVARSSISIFKAPIRFMAKISNE